MRKLREKILEEMYPIKDTLSHDEALPAMKKYGSKMGTYGFKVGVYVGLTLAISILWIAEYIKSLVS